MTIPDLGGAEMEPSRKMRAIILKLAHDPHCSKAILTCDKYVISRSHSYQSSTQYPCVPKVTRIRVLGYIAAKEEEKSHLATPYLQ